MKTFYNHADTYVDEMLEGILAAHPDQLKSVPGELQAIVRADAPVQNKVAIVTGGGSGHLPVFMGYVGKGLLDGASIGNVFASPSMNQMLTVTRAVDAGKGVLYLYGNYGGDVMNFDLAAEMAEEEGITVRTLVAADDIASAPVEAKERRRGVAGILYAYKIAGAAAEAGATLDEVCAVTQKALDNTRTIGVAISPCTVPGNAKPSFEIGPDEMELGMGIHGEAGIKRVQRADADSLVAELFSLLEAEFDFSEGDEVSVLVNSLGATPLEELYIIYRKLHQLLQSRGLTIVKPFVGRYATSMEMAGFSISLCKLTEELKRHLLYPVNTPFIREL